MRSLFVKLTLHTSCDGGKHLESNALCDSPRTVLVLGIPGCLPGTQWERIGFPAADPSGPTPTSLAVAPPLLSTARTTRHRAPA